jgi:hypothetical protein
MPDLFFALRRFWRAGWWFRRLLAASAVGAILLHSGLNIWASFQLNREVAALRARHEPLTVPEVFDGAVSEAQNAAPLYLAAEAALRLSPEARQQLESWSDAAKLLPAEVLDQNRAAFDLVRRAAGRPACRFDVDWSNPMMARLPHLPAARRLARLMRNQAVREAGAGQTDAALGDAEALFRMSRHFAAEPTLISILVARSIEREGYTALAAVLAAAPLSPQQLDRAQQILPAGDWPATMDRAMIAERAFGLWCFENLPADPGAWGVLNPEHEPRPRSWPRPVQWVAELVCAPFRKLDETTYLRYMGDGITFSRRLFSDAASQRRRLNEYDRLPAYWVGTRLLVPAFGGMLPKFEEAEVQRRLAMIAIALAAFRQRTGHYPEALAEIGSGEDRLWVEPGGRSLDHKETLMRATLLEDPHAEGPFRYRREGSGYRLYGVGPNRRDDGGVQSSRGQQDDIVWPNAPAASRG